MFRIHQILLLGLAAGVLYGQVTQLDLHFQSRNVDFSTATSTRPFKSGTTFPSLCAVGEMFFKIDGPAGANLYGCTALNSWSLESTSSGGAGAGMASQLGDFAVVRTSATVLTIGANCSPVTPCQVRFENVVYAVLVGPATLTISAGSVPAYIYVSSAGALTCASASDTLVGSGCTVVTGSSFPSDSTPLFIWTATAGTWDASGGTDDRALFSTQVNLPGAGVNVSHASGKDTFSVDTAYIATLAPQKFFGTTAPGSVAGNLPGDQYEDTTNHHLYTCNAPSGTAAPACTSVTAGGWMQVDGGGGGGSGTVNSGTSGHIGVYPSSANAISPDANLDDGAIAANTLTYTGTGGITASAGPVKTGNDGVHPGQMQLYGNTTLPGLGSNLFNLLGPSSATFTAYGLQLSGTGPAAAGVMLIGAPSGGVSQISFGTVPNSDLTNSAVTVNGATCTLGSTCAPPGYATIDSNGSAVTQRPTVNFISGTNATVTCVDNAGATRTDCTVAATSGSSAPTFPVNAQTATYTLVAADFTNFKTIAVASGTFTITLVASGSQPASGTGVWIINYGSGVITVARNGQNINGAAANLTIAAGSASAPTGLFIVSDATNYVAQTLGGNSSSGGTTLATTGAGFFLPFSRVAYMITNSMSANLSYAYQFVCCNGVSLTANTASVSIMTAQASSNIGIAIYADSSGSPGSLLGNTGGISTATVGAKFGALGSALTLTSGTVYWLVLSTDTTSVGYGTDGTQTADVSALLNQTSHPRQGRCTNTATWTAGTPTFAATCGALTGAGADHYPQIALFP